MVTFVCSYCDITLKKKQLEKHTFGKCRPASFICIDCHKTFQGNDYKAHTSCLTEFEKTWGEYAKPKQKSQPNNNQANGLHEASNGKKQEEKKKTLPTQQPAKNVEKQPEVEE
jgi:hypothetical protein